MSLINLSLLKEQNSKTSAAVVTAFASNEKFLTFSKKQTAGIIKRDEQDDAALATGIQQAVDKKVIPANVEVEPITKIDVMGKTAEEVSDGIIKKLGDATKGGFIMTLEGLSGTGKGTTVALLKEKLGAITWSNGNLFRSVTLLAVTYCEQNGCELADACTPEKLASFMDMIKFDKFNGKWDVEIDGLGYKAYVSEVQNTDLKQGKVGKNIPAVAGCTQGEVINFVQDALNKMVADGISILLEGRGQTLSYIRTPHRFCLVLSDEQIIGKRRAAQRMMADAMEKVGNKDSTTEEEIMAALSESLDRMVDEE